MQVGKRQARGAGRRQAHMKQGTMKRRTSRKGAGGGKVGETAGGGPEQTSALSARNKQRGAQTHRQAHRQECA
jgi:hypothetical protein